MNNENYDGDLLQTEGLSWILLPDKHFLRGNNNKLSYPARMLYLIIQSFANPEKPRPFPGMDVLCRIMDGASSNTVLKYRRELEEKGWLSTAQRRKHNKQFAHNIYTLLSNPIAVLKKPGTAKLSTTSLKGGGKPTAERGSGRIFNFSKLNGNSVIEISRVIQQYAKFSVGRNYHTRNGKEDGTYNKGGQAGGWSRPALLYWEKTYQWLSSVHPPDEVAQTVSRFIKYYDDDKCWFIAQTFPAFAKKYDAIKKFTNYEHSIRVRDGRENPSENIPDQRNDTVKQKQVLKTQAEHDAWYKLNG